jgi:hypothetical protein
MKTRKYIIAAFAALSLGISGCDDDAFLKESPESIFTAGNAFNTVDQVKACLTNTYVHIRYWYQNDTFMKGIGTDLLDTPMWRSSGNGYSNFASWSTSYGAVNNIYVAFFQLVSYANQTLEGTETESLVWNSEAERSDVIAQARFFRGLAYLTLGELFGGVPIVEEFYQSPKYDFVRSTRAETYEFAIKDLEAAAAGLYDYPQEAGRVAKGAAYHYLAEAYLALATEQNNDRALLDKAVASATSAMGLHELMTERFGQRAASGSGAAMNGVAAYYADGDVFFDLFQRGNMDYSEGNKEALWTLQNDVEVWHEFGGNQILEFSRNFSPVFRDAKWKDQYKESGANDSPWNGDIDNTAYPGGNVSAYLGGRGVSNTAPTNYVIDKVWAGSLADDLRNSPANIRRDFICLDRKHSMYGQVVGKDMISDASVDRYYPLWTKFAAIDDWGYEDLVYGGNRSNMFRDEYACRLGETYLLRAEAYLRMDDKGKAAADINVLRNRAGCSYLVGANDVTLTFILDERVRELFMEERRWCTLLRMGGTVVADQLKAHAMYIADYRNYTGDIKWNLFPIPQSAIDANLDAVLEQNPGWD